MDNNSFYSIGEAASLLGYAASDFRRMASNIDKQGMYRIADWADAAGIVL